MWYVFVISFVMLFSLNAQSNELVFAYGSYVYHTDRDKNLNEDNDLLGLRYGHKFNDTVTGGVIFQDFTNSINKKTTLLGGFVEKDIYEKKGFSTGVGLTAAAQIRKGYDVPFLANGYIYAEYDKIRVNAMYVPHIMNRVDEVFIATFEVKLLEW